MAQIEYKLVRAGDLKRHPLHEKMFLNPEEKQEALEWLDRSIARFGKLKSVYYVETIVDDKIKKYYIDGGSTIELYKKNGTEFIFAAKLELTNEEDILQVMTELQRSNHNSPQEEFKMYTALYAAFSKGQGARTDLEELAKSPDEVGIDEDEKKKRRASIFQVIGNMMGGVDKNRVMYILKVGQVCPWYFERMVLERFALYAAYMDCKAKERGEMPAVPTVKEPAYESTATETPVFTPYTSTDDDFNDEAVANEDTPSSANNSAASELKPQVTINNETPGVVKLQMKLSKSLLNDTAAINLIAGEVTVNTDDSQFVIVNVQLIKTPQL